MIAMKTLKKLLSKKIEKQGYGLQSIVVLYLSQSEIKRFQKASISG